MESRISAEDSYWGHTARLIDKLLAAEDQALARAARLIADRMGAGGHVFVYDTGHMLERELIHRAGGLAAFRPFQFSLHLDTGLIHEPPRATGDPTPERLAGVVGYALDEAAIEPGDVLILASVTGTRPVPVELALQARARKIPVVGLTAPTFSAAVPVRHPSGQRLMDVADVVIRNDCAVGDAALRVPGAEAPVAPTSGVSAVVLAWTLVERVTRILVAEGHPPAVIESMNLPDATVRNRQKAAALRAARAAGSRE